MLHAEMEFFVVDDTNHIYRFYPVLRDWTEAEATYADASSTGPTRSSRR